MINGDYDVAVRDVNMALTAYALARAEGSRQEARSREFMDDDEAFQDVA